jgi:hypothetical protein
MRVICATHAGLALCGVLSDGAAAGFPRPTKAQTRVRIYSVHANAFQPLQQRMAQVEDLWRRQLHAFKAFAESPRRTGKLKA